MAFLGKSLISKTGTSLTSTISFTSPFLIYFSASWCPPCRGFTPALIEFYNKVNSPSKQCEIVFASLDESKQEYEEYYKKMPWLAFPFEEKQLVSELAKKYLVESIPSLILVNAQGDNLLKDCRSEVANRGVGALKVFKDLLPVIKQS